jgi:hypothetical protein
MDLNQRLSSLLGQLSEYKPTDHPSWQIGLIFNAILGEVKKGHGEDPVIAALKEVEETMSGNSNMDAGSLSASVSIMLDAVGSA